MIIVKIGPDHRGVTIRCPVLFWPAAISIARTFRDRGIAFYLPDHEERESATKRAYINAMLREKSK